MWNDGRNLEKRLMEDMREVALGTVNNWCKGVIVWNLMLDDERGPWREGGCKTCYGAVDINRGDYKTMTYNSHYYIIGHLSSVVKPGAVRVESKGVDGKGLMYSAFENPDGTVAFVLLNEENEETRLTVTDGKNYVDCWCLPKQWPLIAGRNNLIVLKYHVEIDFSGYIPFSSFSGVGELW